MEIVHLPFETQRNRKPGFLVIDWAPCGSCLQTDSHCLTIFKVLTAVLLKTEGLWKVTPWGLVKIYRGFRRIVVLLCRVKQLSLNCFTLKVKAVRCFETSVPRSTVPEDFDQQLLPVKRQWLWTLSPRCLLSCPSRLRSSTTQLFVGFLFAFTQIVG